ncbi:hypothetical protein BRADI_4g08776v3 [Brachypodium distachyon]|uniref:Uncharacterized protein n=1 Tax=Brachypodium distachyon TaxID=15368 RepID=A0A2K2CLC9_BRADI|nr:hypothetical protein BRADI_4g08776v3 [Brachypodium distachyon]
MLNRKTSSSRFSGHSVFSNSHTVQGIFAAPAILVLFVSTIRWNPIHCCFARQVWTGVANWCKVMAFNPAGWVHPTSNQTLVGSFLG